MTKDYHSNSLELGEGWPEARGREWLRVRKAQGSLQILEEGRTTAVSSVRAWKAVGVDTAGMLLLSPPGTLLLSAPGVPGLAEQPEPELLEVEVGSTALLKCGPSHSQGNFSHVIDWFSVSAGAPEREGISRGALPFMKPRTPLPCCLSLGPQGEANTHLPCVPGPWSE